MGATATQRAIETSLLSLSSKHDAYNANVPPAEWPRTISYKKWNKVQYIARQ